MKIESEVKLTEDFIAEVIKEGLETNLLSNRNVIKSIISDLVLKNFCLFEQQELEWFFQFILEKNKLNCENYEN